MHDYFVVMWGEVIFKGLFHHATWFASKIYMILKNINESVRFYIEEDL